MIYISSLFIWNIEINGNSYLSDEVILDFLEQSDAGFGSLISHIDCAALEESLRSRHDEVVWTSIRIYGTKLTIDIEENLLPEDAYQNTDDGVSYDIVASHDGVITHIFTRSGTPLVSLNDTVTAGQVLVAGYIEITNDDGEVKDTIGCVADADITAESSVYFTRAIDKSYVADEATGNYLNRHGISLLISNDWININNPFFYLPYENYRVLTESSQLKLAEHFYLPIAVTCETYIETAPTDIYVSYESANELSDGIISEYIADLEEKGVQILSKHVMIEETDNNYIVHGEFTVIQSVARLVHNEMTKEGRL